MNAVGRLLALRQHAASSQVLFRTSFEQLLPTPLASSLTGTVTSAQLLFAHTYVASAQPQPVEDEDSGAPLSGNQRLQSNEPFKPLHFDDPKVAFQSKITRELALAYGVLTACQVRQDMRSSARHHSASALRDKDFEAAQGGKFAQSKVGV